ncbi:aa3-type cytochrome c oxidase subunit IV [Paracoccus alkenifer]|uniref:Aa3 type cytochrome c oxidase subunit IV n=1 Tax=Paracoccus alkenifer TaxID=65735 RepID=A0A1H6N838_9RHOB|nr:aa3-type cytochrome c oxidase subunit IV [Paracoccus alkenifer]SEI08614.1 aa3 type cytochrome c oxidase subunit IV [Paracoccus alkenifer]
MATTHDSTHPAAAHVPGTMDATAQQQTFAGFVRFMAWAGGLSIAVVIFLALAGA